MLTHNKPENASSSSLPLSSRSQAPCPECSTVAPRCSWPCQLATGWIRCARSRATSDSATEAWASVIMHRSLRSPAQRVLRDDAVAAHDHAVVDALPVEDFAGSRESAGAPDQYPRLRSTRPSIGSP